MSSLDEVSGSTFLNLVATAQRNRPFSHEEIIQLEDCWGDLLSPAEHSLFLLRMNEEEFHEKAVQIVATLTPEVSDTFKIEASF